MNNLQPLVNKDDLGKPGSVSESFAPINKDTGVASSTTSQNAGLNTFQDIKTANFGETLAGTLSDAAEDNSKKKEDSSAKKDDDNTTASDFRLKILDEGRANELFGSTDILSAIADINAYKFHYKPGADRIDPDATPDKEHVGVMAQELAANPITQATVEEDPLSGFLKVDTKQLTMTTFALVTEMAKKIKELEGRLNEIQS